MPSKVIVGRETCLLPSYMIDGRLIITEHSPRMIPTSSVRVALLLPDHKPSLPNPDDLLQHILPARIIFLPALGPPRSRYKHFTLARLLILQGQCTYRQSPSSSSTALSTAPSPTSNRTSTPPNPTTSNTPCTSSLPSPDRLQSRLRACGRASEVD